MIPEKLYIPTSSLNFNNIMASETISPAIFYQERDFGFRRFEKVPPNNEDYGIFFYERCPIFEIDDKENENFPMILEINTACLGAITLQEIADGVYCVKKTLHLTPSMTRIVFLTEQARTTVRAKSTQSLEAKMADFYKTVVLNDNIASFLWEASISAQQIEPFDISKLLLEDKKDDKLKGFLYAYGIGASRSLPPNVVKIKRNWRKLANIFSAVFASNEKWLTEGQEKELQKISQEIDSFVNSDLQARIKEDLETIRVKSRSESLEQCVSFLDNTLEFLGLPKEELFAKKYKLEVHYSIDRIYNILHGKNKEACRFEYSEYSSFLDNYIQRDINRERRTDASNRDWSVLSKKNIQESAGLSTVAVNILNQYIQSAWDGNSFAQSKFEFAKTGGIVCSKIVKNWETSSERDYINSLLIHFQRHDSFNLSGLDDNVLQSFAAFCQKGTDLGELEEYLILSDIGDFRFAFALWGIVHGFVQLPKTLTNAFFDNVDFNYFCKHIYRQLYGAIDTPSTTVNSYEIISVQEKSSQNGDANLNFLNESQRKEVNKEKSQNNASSEVSSIHKQHSDKISLEGIKQKLNKLSSENFTGDKKEKAIKKILEHCENYTNNEKELDEKINRMNMLTREGRKNVCDILNQKKQTSLSFLSVDTGRPLYLYKDLNAWEKIKHAIPEENQKEVKEQLDWFQEEYANSKSQYYSKAQPKNASSNFLNLIQKKQDKENISKFSLSELEKCLKANYPEFPTCESFTGGYQK